MKKLITTVSLALLPLAASAATLIIPAAGTGAGANNSQWKSDVTIHNTSAVPVTATLTYHDAGGADAATSSVTVGARSTTTLRDVVHTRFNRESGTGAIEVVVPDSAAHKIAVTSRTVNTSPNGEFGQDIPAIPVGDAAAAGDMLVLQAPTDPVAYRFNAGYYAVTASTIKWELVRADGTVAFTSPELAYNAGVQVQINDAVALITGRSAQPDDVLHLFVLKGNVIAYGSAVNNATGDPQYVNAIDARRDIVISFAGVDLDENGSVDVADADHDGVLDAPIDIFTSTFPNFFRIVVNGQAPKFEIVERTGDAILTDNNGTVEWAAAGDVRGTAGALKVKVTVGDTTEIITIPARFR
jgi:hypothetical protein